MPHSLDIFAEGELTQAATYRGYLQVRKEGWVLVIPSLFGLRLEYHDACYEKI